MMPIRQLAQGTFSSARRATFTPSASISGRYEGHSRSHQRYLHCSRTALKEAERRSPETSESKADNAAESAGKSEQEGQKPFQKMTQREKDEAMMARIKARMSQEGDELWEDGQPPTSGMRRHVKKNMFRLI